MFKRLFFLIITLVFVTGLLAQTPYRIKMPRYSYSAQLRGVAGTRTANLTVNGIYSTTFKMHEFNVNITGLYKLYADPNGGSSYVLMTNWGGANGKVVPGDDFADFYENVNTGNQVITSGIASNAVTTDKILNGTLLQADLADSQVSLQKMTTAAVNYIGSGGSITNNPDDVTLENKGGETIGIHDDYIDSVRSAYFNKVEVLRVDKFGAVGNGITDDTNAIQAALDSAYAHHTNDYGPTTVFFPPGEYVVSSINVKNQTKVVGSGATAGPPTWRGTTIIQKPTTNQDIIVIGTDDVDAHWTTISNLSIVGDDAATYGNGIYTHGHPGEGFKISHVQVKNCAGSGIKIHGHSVPLQIEDIHCFNNDSAGIYIYTSEQYESTNMGQLTHVSGDNNGLSLIWIRGSTAYTSGGNILINGVKSETSTAGKQQNVIDIQDFSAGNIAVNSVNNSAAETMISLIRIRNSPGSDRYAPKVCWSGLSTGINCSYYVYDTVQKNDATGSNRDSLKISSTSAITGMFKGYGCNFSEYHPTAQVNLIWTLPIDDTTPWIQEGSCYKTANTATTSITKFDDNSSTVDVGKILYIWCNDSKTTVTKGSYIDMPTSTMPLDSCGIYQFLKIGATLWRVITPNALRATTAYFSGTVTTDGNLIVDDSLNVDNVLVVSQLKDSVAVKGNLSVADTLTMNKWKTTSGQYGRIRTSAQGFILQTQSMSSGVTGGGIQLVGGGYDNDPDRAGISAGSTSDLATHTARSTTSSSIYFNAGTTIFRNDDGLTVGNTFTPTATMTMTADNKVGIGKAGPGSALDVVGGVVADSLTVGTAGKFVRKIFQSVTGDSLGFIYYNTILSRVDTVYSTQ